MAGKSSHSATFLSTVAERWSALAESLVTHGVRSELRRTDVVDKMGIEIRSPSKLALVEAWEHGNCLDVTIIDLATGHSTILSAGACNGSDEIDWRLLALRDALRSN
jgi:hypothetical protein